MDDRGGCHMWTRRGYHNTHFDCAVHTAHTAQTVCGFYILYVLFKNKLPVMACYPLLYGSLLSIT